MKEIIFKKANFVISNDKAKIDLSTVHEFLKTAYWAKGRTIEQIKQSIENSLCFGLYQNGNQVGFARVITDYSTFAYLADVFILPSHQKRGLGKWLIDCIFSIDSLNNVITWLLLTADAHTLYEKVDFVSYPYSERVMMRKKELVFID